MTTFTQKARHCFLVTALFSTGLVNCGLAADLNPTVPAGEEAGPEKWQFALGIYGFVPWVDGTSGAGSQTTDLDLTGGDILDALRFADLLDGEVVYDNRFSAMIDVMYANLGGASTTNRGNRVRLTFRESIIEGRAGYRFISRGPTWLEAYVGLRYWDISRSLSLTGPLGITPTSVAGDSWIDPIVGLRGRYGIAENWGLIGQGDIGGFGIGSDFS